MDEKMAWITQDFTRSKNQREWKCVIGATKYFLFGRELFLRKQIHASHVTVKKRSLHINFEATETKQHDILQREYSHGQSYLCRWPISNTHCADCPSDGAKEEKVWAIDRDRHSKVNDTRFHKKPCRIPEHYQGRICSPYLDCGQFRLYASCGWASHD